MTVYTLTKNFSKIKWTQKYVNATYFNLLHIYFESVVKSLY